MRALWRRQARYGGHLHELPRRILAWQSLRRTGSPTHRLRPRSRDETGSMLALNEASCRSAGARQDHRPYVRFYIGRCHLYRRKADASDDLGGEDSLRLPFLVTTASCNSVNDRTGMARSGSAKSCKPLKFCFAEPRVGKPMSGAFATAVRHATTISVSLLEKAAGVLSPLLSDRRGASPRRYPTGTRLEPIAAQPRYCDRRSLHPTAGEASNRACSKPARQDKELNGSDMQPLDKIRIEWCRRQFHRGMRVSILF